MRKTSSALRRGVQRFSPSLTDKTAGGLPARAWQVFLANSRVENRNEEGAFLVEGHAPLTGASDRFLDGRTMALIPRPDGNAFGDVQRREDSSRFVGD